MDIEVVQAIVSKNDDSIAFFCPKCSELIKIPADKLVNMSVSRSYRCRCLISGCTHEIGQSLADDYIVVWEV